MQDLEIRQAKLSDAESIGKIQVSAWRNRLSQWAPEWFVVRFVESEQTEKYAGRIVDPEYFIFVAEKENAILGFCAIKPNNSYPLEFTRQISALYVDPSFENQGIGTALLGGSLKCSRQKGVKKILVWTFKDNQPARKLYERCGGNLLPYTEAAGMDLDIPHVSYGWL